ncbi:MAG TPA: primosomal protein N' [Bryobacteraceae bacterium]|nr:primosomal protein N' [Bryobacteraceae bacterium]
MPVDPTSGPAHCPIYCDVSLPVPLDQVFTYSLPETLRPRVRTGCRVLAPFGNRKLSGVVIRTHADHLSSPVKEILKLLDEEPVLGADLLELGQWVSEYYCAPPGETLRAMTPLSGEMRRGKIYSLTAAGRDVARQLHLGDEADDAKAQILRLLDARSLAAASLTRKFPKGAAILRALEKSGLVQAEDVAAERDPLRASAGRLKVEFLSRAEKLPKPQRELLSYLELHPGAHNVAEIEKLVPKASVSARALARHNLVRLAVEAPHSATGPVRASHELNAHQQAAFDEVREALEGRRFQTFLLEGVTGSGKTEVYLRAIDAALELDRGALLLVPEIGLTPAVAGQFHQRFAGRVAILHSAFHDAERAQEWRRIQSGEASVVVATRSGVFAPVRNLGLILVDEEHDQSYKQQETPRYHGRDVAVVRARNAGAVVILGSATPSLESRYNAATGKYVRLVLPERIEKRPMPEVTLIDMRQEFLETRKQATFSRALVEAIEARLKNREQTMLLLNRRGFSSFVACRACGERVQCANCSVTLTFHRRDRRMLCHYCNYSERVPEHCPKCGSDYIQFLGLGSERVEEELHGAFPKARIARLDRDSVRGKHDYETVLSAFRDGGYDILVGTQMIAKGHDIPNVTLVGVVNADIGLGLPDFRAGERTFQLLTQAGGRAGRGETPGIVLIQTINPDHYAIRCAAAQDYEPFYRKEIEFRQAMSYPPFSALASVIVRGTREEEALTRSAALGRLLQPAPEGVRVLGPAAATLARLKNEYRYQMLLKAATRKRLAAVLADVRRYAQSEKWNPASLAIDVDPMTLL